MSLAAYRAGLSAISCGALSTALMATLPASAELGGAEIRYSTSEQVSGYVLFSGVSAPVLNNSGTVAFSGQLVELSAPFYNGTGLMTNTAPNLTDLVARANDGTRGAIVLQNFGLTGSGEVVFEDFSTGGSNRIFSGGATGSGSVIADTNDPGETAFDFAGPALNGSSQVVYMTTAPGSGFGTQTLVRDGGAGLGAPLASNTGNNIEQFLRYDTNASNDVVYVADLDGANPTSLFVDRVGSGTTLLADDSDFVNLDSVQTTVVMGADGKVYVRGTTTGGLTGIFRVDESGITSVVNTTDDPYSTINFFSVNANGDIVFLATSGGVVGLYSGTNPTTDKLVEVGDSFDGQSVQLLVFGTEAYNDSDQFAFAFIGGDGEYHVAVGEVVPEPGSLALLTLGAVGLLRRSRNRRANNG